MRFDVGPALAGVCVWAITLLPVHGAAQDVEGTVGPEPAVVAAQGAEGAPASDPAVAESPGATTADDEIAAQLRARMEIATIHRALGIATWVSMAATAVLGWIQFADEYGFHGSAAETACAQGSAVFQDFCTGVPWPHAIAGFTTAALYFTTAGLSLAMPAPVERSADVELHATLRWIHLAGMIAVAAFGIVTANVDTDFQTRQALAATHQGLAVATFGVLTAAAAVVLF